MFHGKERRPAGGWNLKEAEGSLWLINHQREGWCSFPPPNTIRAGVGEVPQDSLEWGAQQRVVRASLRCFTSLFSEANPVVHTVQHGGHQPKVATEDW